MLPARAHGQGTIVRGINAGGAITGWYLDASNVNHGFLRLSDGTIITFEAPGAGTGTGQGTIAFGMNSARAITGQFLDSSSTFHFFLRARDGSITTFDAPGGGTGSGKGTVAANINPATFAIRSCCLRGGEIGQIGQSDQVMREKSLGVVHRSRAATVFIVYSHLRPTACWHPRPLVWASEAAAHSNEIYHSEGGKCVKNHVSSGLNGWPVKVPF